MRLSVPNKLAEEELLNPYYPELNSANQVVKTTLEQTIMDQLSVLEDDPRFYFDLTQNHLMIAVKYLINTRARPNGIVNANKLMQLAKIGTGSKREPILVEAYDSSRWLVLDGNSTTINAVYSGWMHLPCAISESSSEGSLA